MRNRMAYRMVVASFALLCTGVAGAATDELIFKDAFNGRLAEGWFWEREDAANWRVGPGGLEVRVQPGNMWGGANNARNVLVRPIPTPSDAPVEISVALSNAPTAQWEQANLVWFYDDSNMVKLGQELVTGRFSIVMGREEGDRARTVAIVPLDANRVELRLQATGNRVRGQFRTAPWSDWRDVGECDLPVKGEPKASLHFYNGPPNEAHWVKVNDFTVRRLPAASVDWPRVRVAEGFHRFSGLGPDSGMGTISLPGGFTLVNDLQALAKASKAELDQRIFLHRDGSCGWSWDRRASSSKQPTICGIALGSAGSWVPGNSAWLVRDVKTLKSLELELDAVTRLEGDQGDHALAAVAWLSASETFPGPATHRLSIWFDWYGKTSEVQTLNDGYRDYGLVRTEPGDIQYRIKGFRGAPPRVNLKAFLDDLGGREKSSMRVLGVWFGNEVWNGSRGGTLVTRFDCVIDGKRLSSAAPKQTD